MSVQPITNREARAISSVFFLRKFISDGCQGYGYNSISSYVTILRVSGFDYFFHDQYFIKK